MKHILRALGLAFGALIYTIGLDVFLVPNHVIDGGVVGIALMAAQVTGISFSVFIIILNIPFFIFGYKKIGAFFTISSLFSILCLSGWSTFIHYERVTSDPFLSTIYGGIIIGLGVGLIIRWGGSLTGRKSWPSSPTGARLFRRRDDHVLQPLHPGQFGLCLFLGQCHVFPGGILHRL